MKTNTHSLLLILLVIYFAALSGVQVVSPAADGCYPNFTTVEGCNALNSLSTGSGNTGLGWYALFSNIDASFNTAVGAGALVLNDGTSNTAVGTVALLLNSTGSNNTAVGADALVNNTVDDNTATGAFALFSNTIGSNNTANGEMALLSNTIGTFNGAFGQGALASNTTGVNNTGTGAGALFSNTTGNDNTGAGFQALNDNTTGSFNTSIGSGALFSNTTGSFNNANGASALASNTTGVSNTANGVNALVYNTTGNQNTASGNGALQNNTTGSSNTANGVDALFNNATGAGNTALGFDAGLNVTTANNVICVGNPGVNASNTTWIGNIYGATTLNGTTLPVIVSIDGQLGTISSSARFKTDINPMDKTSQSILALKPVTFHYKTDKTNTLQFGLIAEEVAEVNPALVLPDKEGKPYTVRYDAVNAMLLNEFLKEHQTVQELKKQVAELTAGLQKVSAQLELSKPAPQRVLNKQ